MMYVSVPGSAANLGSAFDHAAIALNLRMRARASEQRYGLSLEFHGSELPADSGIEGCIRTGIRNIVADPDSLNLHVEIENDIPLGAGLGSSAAATILGAALATRALDRPISREQLLRVVARHEERAQSAAAALFGGLCIAIEERGSTRAVALPIPPSLRCAFVLSGAAPAIPVISASDPMAEASRIKERLLRAGIESRIVAPKFDVRGLECDLRYAAATLPCAGIAS